LTIIDVKRKWQKLLDSRDIQHRRKHPSTSFVLVHIPVGVKHRSRAFVSWKLPNFTEKAAHNDVFASPATYCPPATAFLAGLNRYRGLLVKRATRRNSLLSHTLSPRRR
jgi:hypothetical protein